MKYVPCVLALLAVVFVCEPGFAQRAERSKVVQSRAADDAPETKASSAESQAALEKAFAKKLTNSVLTGNFTVVGRGDGKPPKPERYEISGAQKLAGNTWLITSRIKYGKVDATVPIPVTVLWAGDTPMISLTNIGIPGMKGKFSCRVLFHGDRYAGTWQHDANGGHMWGMISAGDKKEDDSSPESSVEKNPAK